MSWHLVSFRPFNIRPGLFKKSDVFGRLRSPCCRDSVPSLSERTFLVLRFFLKPFDQKALLLGFVVGAFFESCFSRFLKGCFSRVHFSKQNPM